MAVALTRRRGVATAVFAVLLTSCHHQAATPTPTSARPAGPATGSIVRVGVPEEPASLNPFDARSRTLAGNDVLRTVLPQLFTVAPDGSVHGELADDSSVKEAVRAGGRVVSFSLRSGAVWSDGVAISADDVRFTWETIRSDAWPGPRDGYDRIAGVDGQGRTVTLRFTAGAALPGWRRLFSGDDYVLPAHRLRGQPLATVWGGGPDLSGGPLRLAGVTPGLEVDLDAVPNWWGGHSVAYGRVRVLVVPDVRTMEQLLARGDLDVAAPPATTNRIGRFKAVKGVAVTVAAPGGTLTALYANTEKLPDARRRALFALVDRDRFVSVLLGADEAGDAPSWSPRSGGASPRDVWHAVKVDPAAAKDAVSSSFTATLAAADYQPLANLIGRAIQTRLLDTKARLDIDVTDGAEVDGTWLPSGRFDLALTDEVQWPDPCWRCRFAGDAAGRTDWSRVHSLDSLADAADGDRASTPRLALETRLRADAIVLPLWRPRAVVAARGVRGATPNSWAPGPLWDVTAWSAAK